MRSCHVTSTNLGEQYLIAAYINLYFETMRLMGPQGRNGSNHSLTAMKGPLTTTKWIKPTILLQAHWTTKVYSSICHTVCVDVDQICNTHHGGHTE